MNIFECIIECILLCCKIVFDYDEESGAEDVYSVPEIVQYIHFNCIESYSLCWQNDYKKLHSASLSHQKRPSNEWFTFQKQGCRG